MILRAGLGNATGEGARLRVLAFSERKDLAAFVGDRSYEAAGRMYFEKALGFYTLDSEGRALFAYGADALEDDAFRATITFAATSALPVRSPPWLSKGFFIYSMGFRMDGDRKHGSAAKAADDAFSLLRDKGWMDARLVLESHLAPQGGADEEAFDNASWLLVSYFRNERATELSDYVGRIARGELPHRAFAEAFHGLTPRDVQPLLKQYVERAPEPAGVSAVPYAGELKIARLEDAEVHATWAELYQHSSDALHPNGDPERADLEFKEALRLDPFNVTAQLAGPSMRSLSGYDRRQKLEELAQKKPGDARVWLELARELQPGEEAKETTYLDRAAAAAPGEPLVDAMRAQVLLRWRDFPAALSEAQTALRHGVRDAATLRAEAVALASTGRCEEAAYVERKAAAQVPARASVASEKELFDELQTYEDGCVAPPAPSRPAGLSHPVRDAASCPASPLYPREARVSGGSVEVEYTLSADGRVHAVHAVDPAAPAQVYFAAAEWLRSCAFAPAKTPSGEPVPVRMRMRLQVGK